MASSFTSSLWYYIDCFKTRVSLQHHGSQYHNSFSGSILGLILISVIIWYSYIQFQNILYPEVPLPIQYEFYNETGYSIDLSNTNFLFYAKLSVDDVPMNLSHSYIGFEIYLKNSEGQTQPINYELYGEGNIIATDFNVSIFGEFNYIDPKPHQVIVFKVVPCFNNSVITCAPDSANYEDYFANHIVLVNPFIQYDIYQPLNLDDPFSIDNEQQNLWRFIPGENAFLQIKLSKCVLESVSGWIFKEREYVTSYTYLGSNINFSPYAQIFEDDSLYTLYIGTDSIMEYYKRVFPNISDILINIGGISHSLQSLFITILTFIGLKEIEKKLGSKYLNFKNVKSLDNKGNISTIEENQEAQPKDLLQKTFFENQDVKFKWKNVVCREFVENSIEMTKIMFIRKKISHLASFLLTEKQKVIFDNAELKTESKEEEHNNYEFISHEIAQKLREKHSNVDLKKIDGFICLYKNYLSLLNRGNEIDMKIIQNIHEDTRQSLEELRASSGPDFDITRIEAALLGSNEEKSQEESYVL